MPKLKTRDEVISDFISVHGSLFDYSRVDYVNSQTKVEIICAKHGSFWTKPNSHNNGNGCPSCAISNSKINRTRNVDEVISDFNKVHKNRYIYDKVVYKGRHTKVEIECKLHGIFIQTPVSHISGSGCPTCYNKERANKAKKPSKEYMGRIIKTHGDMYDYSDTVINRTKDHIDIRCRKHGMFSQLLEHHIRGAGCPLCFKVKSKSERTIIEYLLPRFEDFCTMLFNTRPIYFPVIDLRLELDVIFVESGVAIEYNGKHHYDSNSYFSKKQRESKYGYPYQPHRDEFKQMWCKRNNIKLIEIPYWEYNMQQPKCIRDEFLHELSYTLEDIL